MSKRAIGQREALFGQAKRRVVGRGRGAGAVARIMGQQEQSARGTIITPFRHAHSAASPSQPGESRVISFASPEALEAFNYGPAPLLLSGGFGAGKTATLCIKAMYLSSIYPGNRGLIARKQGEKLKKTTMPTFFKFCPPEAYMYGRRADHEKSLRLNNGSEILWAHLDDSEIIELLRGLEINWFLIDQAEEVSEEIVDVLIRRLGRWDQVTVPQELIDAEQSAGRAWPWYNEETGVAIPPTYAMFSANPDHELHWLYRRFHPQSREWRDKYRHEGYKMISMSSRQNKFLPKQNLNALLAGTKEFVDRFVDAKWGIPAGTIHKIDAKSLLKMSASLAAYIRKCKLSRAMDHGESAPTCVLWFAADQYGNLICYREYYKPGLLISEHRKNIKVLSMVQNPDNPGHYELEKYSSELADPSIFAKRVGKGGIIWSVAEEYMDSTNVTGNSADDDAIYWTPGDNDELGTRNRINEYLKIDPKHRHPITGELGAPRLYFVQQSLSYVDGCLEVLKQLRSQKRIKIGTQDGADIFSDDRDEKIEDHAYDPLRYYVADCPGLAGEEKRKIPARSLMAAQLALKALDAIKGKRRIDTSRRLDMNREAFFNASARRRGVL